MGREKRVQFAGLRLVQLGGWPPLMSLIFSRFSCASHSRNRSSFSCVRERIWGTSTRTRGRRGGPVSKARPTGGQHQIDPTSQPYAPAKLERKEDVPIGDFFKVDMRIGTITTVLDFPEMRKPSYKIEVDFGPVVGKKWSSAQITNYSHEELLGRKVVGTINLGKKKLPTSFMSEFLVMGALNPDGSVRLLQVPSDTLDGSCVA